jgi:hypothetical protein
MSSSSSSKSMDELFESLKQARLKDTNKFETNYLVSFGSFLLWAWIFWMIALTSLMALEKYSPSHYERLVNSFLSIKLSSAEDLSEWMRVH